MRVEGYKLFGKHCINQDSLRGEGGVGFLAHECLVNDVKFINTVKYRRTGFKCVVK